MSGAQERQTVAGAYQAIESHEQLCALRYDGINQKLHWIMGGLGATLVGLFGWMALQLYTLEPLRIAASTQGQRVIVQTGHQ